MQSWKVGDDLNTWKLPVNGTVEKEKKSGNGFPILYKLKSLQQITKRKARTKKKSTAKHREKKKKRVKDGVTSRGGTHNIFIRLGFYRFISSLNLSISLFFKSEFLFGKTNRVRFHEKFLTPWIKLLIQVHDS